MLLLLHVTTFSWMKLLIIRKILRKNVFISAMWFCKIVVALYREN